MKKYFKIIAAAIFLPAVWLQCSSASADELAKKHNNLPAQSNAPFDWSGFYLGADIGGAWQDDNLIETQIGNPGYSHAQSAKSSSLIGGLHFGYNFEQSPLVLGIEADVQGTGLQHSTLYSNSALARFGSQTSVQGSIRGRAGFALDRMLIYATGGPAFAQIDNTYSYNASQDISTLRIGYTVGAGVEAALAAHWLGRLEYRYSDFGTIIDLPTIPWSGYPESRHETESTVMLGVSYKF